MGSSEWSYIVAFQPDLRVAFQALQAEVLAAGDYWWAVPGELASHSPNRPRSIEELFENETVQASGTHSILDMDKVLTEGEPPKYGWLVAADHVSSPFGLTRLFRELGEPEYGTVVPVTAAEALECTGVEKLTRDHLEAIDDLAVYRGFGRCAILHDPAGMPEEIYFWGRSGD